MHDVKQIRELIASIDPERLYTVKDIQKAGYFFWTNSPKTVYRIIQRDIERNGLLNTVVTNNGGKRKFYWVEGQNLKRYLKTTIHNI